MKKLIATDYGKYNKVLEILNTRTDEQILKGWEATEPIAKEFWVNVPEEVMNAGEEAEDAWVFEKYPTAEDVFTVRGMYMDIMKKRFPEAYRKWLFGLIFSTSEKSIRKYL